MFVHGGTGPHKVKQRSDPRTMFAVYYNVTGWSDRYYRVVFDGSNKKLVNQ